VWLLCVTMRLWTVYAIYTFTDWKICPLSYCLVRGGGSMLREECFPLCAPAHSPEIDFIRPLGRCEQVAHSTIPHSNASLCRLSLFPGFTPSVLTPAPCHQLPGPLHNSLCLGFCFWEKPGKERRCQIKNMMRGAAVPILQPSGRPREWPKNWRRSMVSLGFRTKRTSRHLVPWKKQISIKSLTVELGFLLSAAKSTLNDTRGQSTSFLGMLYLELKARDKPSVWGSLELGASQPLWTGVPACGVCW